MYTTQIDLMDQSIGIVILLFILSMISERFINWIKLYFFKKNNNLFGFHYSLKFDYSTKTENEQLEKIRERKIIEINIVCSIIISILIGANFFEIIKCPIPYEGLAPIFDLGIEGLNLNFFIGTIITGLFMSMGSKFWHDTLDMLFAVKRLRQKASDPNSYKAENIEQLKEYVETSNYEIVKMAFDKNANHFYQIKGVHGCGIEFDELKRQYIIVIHQDKSSGFDHVSPFINHTLRHGQIIEIPVKTTETEQAKIQGETLRPSYKIAYKNYKENSGSIGIFLEDNNKNRYLLTCYHCIADRNQNKLNYNLSKGNEVFCSTVNKNIGNVNHVVLNNFMDAALVKLHNNITIENKFKDIKSIPKYLNIYQEGSVKMTHRTVHVRGNKSHANYVRITGINYHILFDYSSLTIQESNTNKTSHKLFNLIGISSVNNEPVTQPGDSGCPVFDSETHELIGIVIGSDKINTYVIPVDRILQEFSDDTINFKLYKNK